MTEEGIDMIRLRMIDATNKNKNKSPPGVEGRERKRDGGAFARKRRER